MKKLLFVSLLLLFSFNLKLTASTTHLLGASCILEVPSIGIDAGANYSVMWDSGFNGRIDVTAAYGTKGSLFMASIDYIITELALDKPYLGVGVGGYVSAYPDSIKQMADIEVVAGYLREYSDMYAKMVFFPSNDNFFFAMVIGINFRVLKN